MSRARQSAAQSKRKRSGESLQRDVDKYHAGLRDLGVHVYPVPPEFRVMGTSGKTGRHTGFFVGAGPCDYGGTVDGVPIHFDVKRCTEERFDFSRLVHVNRRTKERDPSQARHLDACLSAGGAPFLFVQWTSGGTITPVVLPWFEIKGAFWHWFEHGGRPASVPRSEALALGYRCNGLVSWVPAFREWQECWVDNEST